MAEKPIILGIETSCDETAVSLIQDHDDGVPKIFFPGKVPQSLESVEFMVLSPNAKYSLLGI